MFFIEVSEDKLEIVDKIREFRDSEERIKVLEAENELLKFINVEYKNKLIDLFSDNIERTELLDEISNLKMELNRVKLDLENVDDYFEFLITSPNKVSSVLGEIRRCLNGAKEEVLVCSPWITYLANEFKNFNKNVKIKVITNWRREDIKSGITDLDKLRVLDDLGADIRFNNDLHAKMLIIDSKEAIISSANFTRRGFQVNYEAGVIIRKKTDVSQAVDFFNGVWEESKSLTMEMITKKADSE